jgi:tight adherence protein B
VGLSLFVLTYVNAERILGWLKEQSLGNREYVIKKLDMMFVPVDAKKITGAMIMVSFGMGGLFFVLLWPYVIPGVILAVLATVIGWKLPKKVVDAYQARRSSQFVDQMVDGLTLMSNGLKSGLSIPQAMKVVVDNMPDPISQEFELMLSQQALGVSIEDIFNNLAKRIPNPDVQMFVIAVNILSGTGGNIAATFDTIVKTIRERIKIEKKIAAVTAQGVMQGTIISLMPLVLLILMWFTNRSLIEPMFTRPLGWVLLGIMLILEIIGSMMIRKIVKIKV